MKVKCIALFSILLLASQLLLVDCEKQKKRKNGRDGEEERKQLGSPDKNERDRKAKGGKNLPRGRFSTQDNVPCTWAVTEKEGVTLRVQCKGQETQFECTYAGNPSSCPQFVGNEKAYWKQIGRALRKQKNLCADPKSVLKSRVCKKGAKEAHLKMVDSTIKRGKKDPQTPASTGRPAALTIQSTGQQLTTQKCVEDIEVINQRKMAEEYCGESWSSLCTFLLTMFQDKKC
ncbi:fibroblast growth factor-binding protein 1 [Trichosurus vulpecula]|uniref:fibroblast growth factor-binding protein 1 n=1 Tax=Trichosurus vulpecula TaxID=9337 RepID=UPI00186B0C57|nr:fibroblast growth factor-binding protein 1 [Trichosurus vulpecula]XP_036620977.1 fibroblast growth factor-binding protein 1 [Trichosurus vulpecula]